MRRLSYNATKILVILMAIILPIIATSVIGVFYSTTKSVSAAAYYNSYIEDVSVTNGNFSSSSVTSISSSPSGWTRQNSNKTTAGVINTGTNFDTYKSGTYYLSNNPGTMSQDDTQILMINSKTSKTSTSQQRDGYISSSITLDANSYYLIQASFKSDTNYDETTTYSLRGTLSTSEDYSVSQSNFNSTAFTDDDPYVPVSVNSSTYYIQKKLTDTSETASVTSSGAFYFDGDYVGIMADLTDNNTNNPTPIYFAVSSISSVTLTSGTTYYVYPDSTDDTQTLDSDVTVSWSNVTIDEENEVLGINNSGLHYYVSYSTPNYTFSSAYYYTCDELVFTPNDGSTTEGNYTVVTANNISYYAQEADYESRNEYGKGSIYISGLVDENGDDVTMSVEGVISTTWTTFYFFIATGDDEQTITIDLWLGGQTTNDTSTGVVFFDDVKMAQYSENYFYTTYLDYLSSRSYTQHITTTNGTEDEEVSCVRFTSLVDSKDYITYSGYNFNFEDGKGTNGIQGWTFTSNSSSGHARIVSLASADDFNKETNSAYTYVGSNMKPTLTYDTEGNLTAVTDNAFALALWADDAYAEVTSQDINIAMHGYYKITVYFNIVSLDEGTAYLTISENDTVLTTYGLTDSDFELATGSASATENETNSFTNNYSTLTIYVKGADFYNSSINISLSIGTADENATGCVMFDDLTIENVDYEEYSSADTTVALWTPNSDASPSISNGYFNVTENTSTSYPLAPADWTIEQDSTLTYGGVINVLASEYASYVEVYNNYTGATEDNPYLWAQFSNPLSSSNSSAYSNNILMLCNYNASAQTVTSPTISLDASSYYALTFDYKTYSTSVSKSASFNIKIYNDNDILLFEQEDVLSTSWTTKTIYFETFKGSETITIEIEFGTSDDKVSGLAYFDNFVLSTSSSTTIEEQKEKNSNNVVDLTDYYINLPTTEIGSTLKDFSSPAYSYTTWSDSAKAGILGATNLNQEYQDMTITAEEDETLDDIRAFVLQTEEKGQAMMQSLFTFDFTSDTYYKLTFKVKTTFNYMSSSRLPSDFDTADYEYGLTIGFSNFEYMTNIVCNDEYCEYTLYIYCTEDTTETLYMCLVSDSEYTTGTAVIYNINFEELELGDDEDEPAEYTSAMEAMKESDYDINDSKVFATKTAEDEEEDTEEDNTETEETDETEDDYSWLLWISTLITALAIIIAVVGALLRRVRIRKIEIKRKETYDRKGTIHRDVIRREAEEERATEAQKLEADITKFENELASIESEHKETVVALRKDNDKQNSKKTEKEFKAFAEKRSAITEKIDVLKHQLENVNSPEYLLTLERKKYFEHEATDRKLEKASKQREKEIEKARREQEKNSKTNNTDKTDK